MRRKCQTKDDSHLGRSGFYIYLICLPCPSSPPPPKSGFFITLGPLRKIALRLLGTMHGNGISLFCPIRRCCFLHTARIALRQVGTGEFSVLFSRERKVSAGCKQFIECFQARTHDMISYEKLWITMKEKGVTQYALIKQYHVSPAQITRLKRNESVSTHTIDMFCRILSCRVEDIMEYVKEVQE